MVIMRSDQATAQWDGCGIVEEKATSSTRNTELLGERLSILTYWDASRFLAVLAGKSAISKRP